MAGPWGRLAAALHPQTSSAPPALRALRRPHPSAPRHQVRPLRFPPSLPPPLSPMGPIVTASLPGSGRVRRGNGSSPETRSASLWFRPSLRFPQPTDPEEGDPIWGGGEQRVRGGGVVSTWRGDGCVLRGVVTSSTHSRRRHPLSPPPAGVAAAAIGVPQGAVRGSRGGPGGMRRSAGTTDATPKPSGLPPPCSPPFGHRHRPSGHGHRGDPGNRPLYGPAAAGSRGGETGGGPGSGGRMPAGTAEGEGARGPPQDVAPLCSEVPAGSHGRGLCRSAPGFAAGRR